MLTDPHTGHNELGGQAVPISSIVVDLALQPRAGGLDTEHIRTLEEVIDSWPPLAVVVQGSRFVLVDGFHRLAAAQNLDRETVVVHVLSLPIGVDLRGLAFQLNAAHGRPLTLQDRRAEAARRLRMNAETSDREIGRQCGLSQPTVAKVRAGLEAGAQIEQASGRVGADGRTYPVSPREADDEQSRLASYLERLSRTLERSNDYPAWTSDEDAGGCLLACYAEDDIVVIAEMLGRNAMDVVNVAIVLGWEPDEESS